MEAIGAKIYGSELGLFIRQGRVLLYSRRLYALRMAMGWIIVTSTENLYRRHRHDSLKQPGPVLV